MGNCSCNQKIDKKNEISFEITLDQSNNLKMKNIEDLDIPFNPTVEEVKKNLNNFDYGEEKGLDFNIDIKTIKKKSYMNGSLFFGELKNDLRSGIGRCIFFIIFSYKYSFYIKI